MIAVGVVATLLAFFTADLFRKPKQLPGLQKNISHITPTPIVKNTELRMPTK
jgi:hypothetical protein